MNSSRLYFLNRNCFFNERTVGAASAVASTMTRNYHYFLINDNIADEEFEDDRRRQHNDGKFYFYVNFSLASAFSRSNSCDPSAPTIELNMPDSF